MEVSNTLHDLGLDSIDILKFSTKIEKYLNINNDKEFFIDSDLSIIEIVYKIQKYIDNND